MHRLLLFALSAALLSGCATASITPIVKEKPARPYRKVMTLFVDKRMDFRRFDEATYNEHLIGHFNSLSHIEFRQQLEHSLQRNLNAKNSQVFASSELFEVNTVVPYEEFMATLADYGVEAILFVNLSGYWFTESRTYDPDSGVYTKDEEPNAAYLCYLIDLQTGRPFWMAETRVKGILAGYDTLNNHLARKLAQELRRERYVYQPVNN